MRSRLKKTVTALLALALILCFAGCEARIDVYEQQDENNKYFELNFVLTKSAESALNDSGMPMPSTGTWTVDKWLSTYFSAIEDRDFAIRYGGKYHDDDGNNIYRYFVTVPLSSDSSDVNEAFSLSGETDVKTNLFMRTVSVKRDDRFNYWLRSYAEAAARKEAGAPEPMDYHSMMGIVLNGRIDTYPQYQYGDEEAVRQGLVWNAEEHVYQKTVCPSFFEAFDTSEDVSDLVLNNFWYASQKMRVACDAKVYVQDENGVRDKKGVYYLFGKSVADGETAVEYEYFRADPTGWYLVALVCGALAVLLVILIAKQRDKRKNKPQKPRTQDQFPYDPFGEDGRIDPFA